jgi:hypothetical protein
MFYCSPFQEFYISSPPLRFNSDTNKHHSDSSDHQASKGAIGLPCSNYRCDTPSGTLDLLLTETDMGPFLKDPNSQESNHIVDQVRSACETSGFFQLTNHGVPVKLQESLFKAAHSFFKLPYDEKKKLDCKQNLGHRGYDVLASQSYEPGVMPDLKEVTYPVPAQMTLF